MLSYSLIYKNSFTTKTLDFVTQNIVIKFFLLRTKHHMNIKNKGGVSHYAAFRAKHLTSSPISPLAGRERIKTNRIILKN